MSSAGERPLTSGHCHEQNPVGLAVLRGGQHRGDGESRPALGLAAELCQPAGVAGQARRQQLQSHLNGFSARIRNLRDRPPDVPLTASAEPLDQPVAAQA